MAKDTAPGKPHPGKSAPGRPAAADPDRRTWSTLPLAQLVPGLTRAAYRKRSPAGALLMSDWALIVGEMLAAQTEPRRLSGTQLTIACSGPVAMELQHVSATLIERINVQAGRRLVASLRFIQDFTPGAPPLQRRRVAPEAVEGVAEGPLNEALAALRAAILSRSLR